MKLDTKNPYRVIFWIAVATIFASLSVAVLVGQFGRRTTDPFFTDNPTRRLSDADVAAIRSEEHTSELQSLMRISYAVFCLKKQNNILTAVYHTQATKTKTH